MTYVRGDTYKVVDVSNGIVRNLLKTIYYLRIPRQESDNLQKQDRDGQTIPLHPGVDTCIFWKDFDVVSNTLKQLDQKGILKIIQYPQHQEDYVGVQQDGTTVVDQVRYIDFHGATVSVVNEGNSTVGVTVTAGTGVATSAQTEVAFASTDWEGNQIVVIPTGAPTTGQVGPHLLPVQGYQYVVNQYQTVSASTRRPVGMGTLVDFSTGFITIMKAPTVPNFSGVLVISVTTP